MLLLILTPCPAHQDCGIYDVKLKSVRITIMTAREILLPPHGNTLPILAVNNLDSTLPINPQTLAEP